MAQSFKRLERVLLLETKQGYQNKAVVGGIRQFAAYWVEKAREEASDDSDRAFVEQVSEALSDYARLPNRDARESAVRDLLEKLKNYQQRRQQAPLPLAQPARPAIARKEKPPAPPEPAIEPEPAPEPATADPEGLSQPVTVLKGVGPKIAQYLERLGAETIWNLLYLFPRRYDDYTLMKPINRLNYGETVTIIGTIWRTRARPTRNNKTMVQSVIGDGTGTIQATWFNQRWLADKLKPNMQIVLSGTVEQYLGRLVMNNPEWEPLAWDPLRTRRIVPVYPLTEGLSSHKLREIVKGTVERWADRVPDPLPESIRARRKLYNLCQALQQIHFPDNRESLSRARQRLVFDELFLLQLGMLGKRQLRRAEPATPLQMDAEALSDFQSKLPFALTGAQKRVIGEIAADMARDVPMNRLLQGDVGSGKTVVAAAAILIAVRSGAQAAMMVPTEILAEQHYASLNGLLGEAGVAIRLLTGSTPAAEKTEIYQALAEGSVDLVVGTHALIQERVQFQNLGLAIVDEQHRFGVEQRGALRQKGGDGGLMPHLLVMSATPIPRTLALSVYGDLDLSVLDEMPPGRQEIKTYWVQPRQRERAYVFIRKQVEEGRQAYVIYPLVEESDKIEANSAAEGYEILQREIFPDLKLGLLHGRMSAAEKEAVMRDFHEGRTNVLVSTSVIEVGVDVPNSTVMVIEDANRFGLAQLHQFRGRVGRGEHQSYCILIAADGENGTAGERLRSLEQTNDGFELAEKDLELRGPGEFFGQRQSGLPELRMASLLDMESLEMAREEAERLIASDPDLEQPENEPLRKKLEQFWEKAGDIS